MQKGMRAYLDLRASALPGTCVSLCNHVLLLMKNGKAANDGKDDGKDANEEWQSSAAAGAQWQSPYLTEGQGLCQVLKDVHA